MEKSKINASEDEVLDALESGEPSEDIDIDAYCTGGSGSCGDGCKVACKDGYKDKGCIESCKPGCLDGCKGSYKGPDTLPPSPTTPTV